MTPMQHIFPPKPKVFSTPLKPIATPDENPLVTPAAIWIEPAPPRRGRPPKADK